MELPSQACTEVTVWNQNFAEASLSKYRMIKHLGWAYGMVLMTTRKLAGDHSYKQEFSALKFLTKWCQENVELKVFRQSDSRPYLLHLVSFFQTKKEWIYVTE